MSEQHNELTSPADPISLLPYKQLSARKQARIAVISNKNSGHNRDNFARVAKIIGEVPSIDHYPTGSEQELPDLLQAVANSNPEILVVNGGDGTAAAIFAHLLEASPFAVLPTIALLPGGTANMTAGDIGIRGSLLRATKRLCEWSRAGVVNPDLLEKRYVLRVQAGTGAPDRYGMFFGAGAVIQGTEYAHRKIHSKGLRDDLSLGLGTVRTLWGIVRGEAEFNRPLPVKLRMKQNDNFQNHDMRILAVSSLHRLFLGFHPFWGEGDEAINVSFVTRGAQKLLSRFPGVLLGRPGRSTTPEQGYHSYTASFLQLEMDGSFNLDGEIVSIHSDSGPVTITAAGPLTFLRL